jgi:hypothetical protein
MTFGADGVSSFQGTKLSVIKKIVDGWVPHSMGCIVWLIEPHYGSNSITFANDEHN